MVIFTFLKSSDYSLLRTNEESISFLHFGKMTACEFGTDLSILGDFGTNVQGFQPCYIGFKPLTLVGWIGNGVTFSSSL